MYGYVCYRKSKSTSSPRLGDSCCRVFSGPEDLMQCSEHCAALALYTNKHPSLNMHQTGIQVCGLHCEFIQDCYTQANGCSTCTCISEPRSFTNHPLYLKLHPYEPHPLLWCWSPLCLHQPVLQQLLVCPGDMLHHSNHPGNASSIILSLLGEGEGDVNVMVSHMGVV